MPPAAQQRRHADGAGGREYCGSNSALSQGDDEPCHRERGGAEAKRCPSAVEVRRQASRAIQQATAHRDDGMLSVKTTATGFGTPSLEVWKSGSVQSSLT